MALEHEGIYPKYLVFRHPDFIPVSSISKSFTGNLLGGPFEYNDMVEDFVFVLKPNSDKYAVIALAAYAMAVRDDNPQLSADLRGIVEEYR